MVDLNTKVYGTDNLFVIDGSIFPGQTTGNPSAAIVITAEHAADKVLALAPPTLGKAGDTCDGAAWIGSFSCAAGLECVDTKVRLSLLSSMSVQGSSKANGLRVVCYPRAGDDDNLQRCSAECHEAGAFSLLVKRSAIVRANG